ncbi:MAG: 50S ribosomal protein L25 [Tissierellia bacterium]|nr:50S ribosomal protein L25 [Tissierellia bacterium]
MADIVLTAGKREGVGKNKVDKLRRNELIPGVVYAKDEENINVQIPAREFNKVIRKAGTSTVIDLDIDGEKRAVLIKDYQMHPFKEEFLHVDFQAIKAGEKIRVTIPVVLLSRDEIKVQPSVLIQNIDSLEVECIPRHIPKTAEIDVKDMQIGDSFFVSDLDVYKDEDIEVLEESDAVVCSLQEPQEEIIPEDEEEDVEASEVPTVEETEEESEE